MDLEQFKEQVRLTFRLNLHSYKEKQLVRRINLFASKHGVKDYGTLFKILSSDRKMYEAFLDHLTINVSEFFRDPVRFDELKNVHLKNMLRQKKRLKIWSAACANGAEPYSVAIILDELSPGQVHNIEATDIDQEILKKAVEGRYSSDAVRNVSRERLQKYFSFDGTHYIIHDRIKRVVSFRRHDLLVDEYGRDYDLILCRNVTIYFTRQAQDEINRKFSRSLVPGGILFIGGSEMIFNSESFGLMRISPCFYKKIDKG